MSCSKLVKMVHTDRGKVEVGKNRQFLTAYHLRVPLRTAAHCVSKEPFYEKKMVIHGDLSLKGERQTRRFGTRGSTGPANVDLCFFDPQQQAGDFSRNK